MSPREILPSLGQVVAAAEAENAELIGANQALDRSQPLSPVVQRALDVVAGRHLTIAVAWMTLPA
jgi:hypothetical protein